MIDKIERFVKRVFYIVGNKLLVLNQRTISVLGFVFLCNNLSAQYDTIKFSNGGKQAAKIIEISDKYVKYKNPLDTLGPTFSVKRKDVAGFVLKNGCLSMEQQGYVNCVKDPTFDIIKDKEFKRRIISVDVSQFFVKHFQMNAEYIFNKKANSINLFYNFGLLDENDKETYTSIETKLFGTGYFKKTYFGGDIKFFPSSHKKLTYFYALGFDYGTAYKMLVTAYYSGIYNIMSYKTTFPEARYFGYRFNNGLAYRFTRNFLLQAVFSLGVDQYSYHVENSIKIERMFSPKISTSILFGYSF